MNIDVETNNCSPLYGQYSKKMIIQCINSFYSFNPAHVVFQNNRDNEYVSIILVVQFEVLSLTNIIPKKLSKETFFLEKIKRAYKKLLGQGRNLLGHGSLFRVLLRGHFGRVTMMMESKAGAAVLQTAIISTSIKLPKSFGLE